MNRELSELNVDNKSLRCLEWERLCTFLSSEALSVPGREICRQIPLSDKKEDVERLLDETEESATLITERSELLVDRVPDLRKILESAGAGAQLGGDELVSIRNALAIARRVRGSLELMSEDSFPALCSYLEELKPVEAVRREIDRCFDDRGELQDDASSELRSLRASVRRLHSEIKDELGRMIHSATVGKALQEPIFTQRSGRYVLPVDANKRGSVNGIVHDSSQSGLTVYVEPMSVVEPTNRIRLKETEIDREIQRIMAMLSSLVKENLRDIESTFSTLIQLDVIMARARLALRYSGVRPEVSAGDTVSLIESRHPLLVLQKEKQVIPNTVTLGGGARTLVITGPNTGGKTVLLKQIGLMALMVKAGLLLPAKEGSVIPIFNRVWADIGDEQSLEQSLSTFSSHMQTVVEVVRNASKGMLILLDEIGVGTDPKEGAAIARAVLEHLNGSGSVTVSTTHYGELKMLAYSEEGFVNGSLEFDQSNLTPTYRLRIGVAGSSKATTIAVRLGLDEGVVKRANDLLEGGEKELSEAINELEERLLAVAHSEEKVRSRELELEDKARLLELEQQKTKAYEEEVRSEYASKLKKELDYALGEVRRLTKEMQTRPSLQKVSQSSERMSEIREELGWLDPAKEVPTRDKPLQVGERVKVRSLNQIGVLEELVEGDGGKSSTASVLCGNMKVKVNTDDLEHVSATPQPSASRRRSRKMRPQAPVRRKKGGARQTVYAGRDESETRAFIQTSGNTLDLRGKRVDESLDSLDEFLDKCLITSTSPVMVIHGHGTGALKSAVREHLKKSRYSRNYRPGELYEGGDGVTVIELE